MFSTLADINNNLDRIATCLELLVAKQGLSANEEELNFEYSRPKTDSEVAKLEDKQIEEIREEISSYREFLLKEDEYYLMTDEMPYVKVIQG